MYATGDCAPPIHTESLAAGTPAVTVEHVGLKSRPHPASDRTWQCALVNLCGAPIEFYVHGSAMCGTAP